MKTLLIIIVAISAYFAVSRAWIVWKQFRTRNESKPKIIGFTTLAFIVGAIIWPVLPIIWGVNWLKENKPKYRYLILAHSRLSNEFYTYGYIMPWWWKNRLKKTCKIFNQDEDNVDRIQFRVITELEYNKRYQGTKNFTEYGSLLGEDFVRCYGR